MWTDSHCHLHDEQDPFPAYERAVAAGVDRIVLVGTGESSSQRAVQLAGELSGTAIELSGAVDEPFGKSAVLYATVGQHPHDAAHGTEKIAALLEGYVVGSALRGVPGSVVAVGECGLDYHYGYSSRDAQLLAFAEQVELARRHSLTVVVHTREAWDDTFSVLTEVGVPDQLIIHCFTGGPEEARRCLELGAYLSFSGIITFKNAGSVREAAQLCPIEQLLTETDAPYLAPVPHRGAPNEPAYVAVVGAALADLRATDAEQLARETSENAARVFGLTQ